MRQHVVKRIFVIGALLILNTQTASAQLLGRALSLGNTLGGYVFDLYLRTEKTVSIEGAPDWYLQNDDPQWDCAFGYEPGSLASVEKAKTEATKHLAQRVHIRVHHSKIHNLKPKENLLSDVQIILCHWDTILINLVGGYHTDLLAYTSSQFTRSAHLNILSIQDIVPSWHQSNSEQNSGETEFSNLAYLL